MKWLLLLRRGQSTVVLVLTGGSKMERGSLLGTPKKLLAFSTPVCILKLSPGSDESVGNRVFLRPNLPWNWLSLVDFSKSMKHEHSYPQNHPIIQV